MPRKNQSRVIDAFSRLAKDFPEWRLQIVGDGPQRSQLEAQARSLGVVERIDFAGEHDDVYPFYAGADLFVIPSFFEGFPLTLCEAMAHGLPAIGFDLCAGVRAQIKNEKTGVLCKDGSVESLEAALRRMMGDGVLRGQMGRAARRAFVRRFSNATVHAAWEDMLDEARQAHSMPHRPDHNTVMAVRLWERVWGPITRNSAV